MANSASSPIPSKPRMKTIRSKTEARQLKKAWKQSHDSGVELCFLLQDWEDGYNVGGMFRVADGVAAKELVMTGRTPVPPHPMIGVTSLGGHRRIPYRYFEKHEEAAKALVAEGWTLVAIEIAEGATPFHAFEFPPRTCLVLGNEGGGVYGTVLKHCAAAIFIPMFGKGRSLNVHVAAAIVAFRARLGG